MSVKMLLVVHPLCNRVVVSIWFYVSQFMFVKVYISVKVQLKCITVNISYLSFHISFIGYIYSTYIFISLHFTGFCTVVRLNCIAMTIKLNEYHHIFIISLY